MAYIYLIRHTTPAVQKGVCYGQTNLDIMPSFEEEFLQIIEKLQGFLGKNAIQKIYTSPLLRCQKLAQTLNQNMHQYANNQGYNIDFLEDARLMEMDFGEWEMKTWAHIHENDTSNWMNNFVTTKTPNGESFEGLMFRVREFWEEILALSKEENDNKNANKNIAIITHAGVIRAILALVLGFPLENAFRLEINYGGICVLKQNKDFVQILHVNK